MKDNTLILLEKITKTFNLITDFLMKETSILTKKLAWEGVILFSLLCKLLTKLVKKFCHFIEETEDWQFFKNNFIRLEKKLLKRVPKPALEIIVYILDSVLYFIKTTISIVIKLIRFIILDTYKQIKNLPHTHQRFLFITVVVFLVGAIVFKTSIPDFADMDTTCIIEEQIKEKDTPVVETIIEDPTKKHEVIIKSGDTLVEILQVNAIEYNDIDSVLKALKTCYNPKKLAPGHKLNIIFEDNQFVGLEISISVEEMCIIEKTKKHSFSARTYKKELITEIIEKKSTITSSIFKAGEKNGIPHSIMVELIKMYSWDVDFVRDIRKNDTFTVMYERLLDKEGSFVKNGNIIYSNMTLSGTNIPLYRYKGDYYKENGSNIKKALLRTPINGARVSSRYGYRKHPISGYSKKHTGIDFAAPTGTPIYAAGDGKITRRAWNGGYGNYIQIRHSSTMSTAYGHMSRFASNLKVGSRVKQGQVVGYVGSTGYSTGPHLHYEIVKNGHKVNPATVKLPNKQSLAGNDLKSFKQETLGIRTKMGTLCIPTKKPI